MTSIAGSVVLVTGGQRGLGKAFVKDFLDHGATKVYATARTPTPSDDPRIVPLPLEITDSESVAALKDRVGDVSIVVNNAGSTVRGAITQADIGIVKTLFEANVFGALRVTQTLAPILAKNGGGAIININSVMSWVAGAGAYGATKAALWSITNSTRLELAKQGTHVIGVHFGYIATDMTAALDVVKNDPADVVRGTLAALERGETEVLADDVSRRFKAALAGPVEGLALSAS